MAYPFRQGIDYGPRDGTRGLSFHMAEGGDGTLGFLSRHAGETFSEWVQRVRGVSCNALILRDGTLWQMLPWDHCSGNLNPDDRAGEYGYYGHHHLEDVLGPQWKDPNMWTISAELCGWRSSATAPDGVVPGPTDAQVETAIRWGLEMCDLFPTIRGATGHHDQSPKGCPGTTPNMKAIFNGLGGHGLWIGAPEVAGLRILNPQPYVGTATIKKDGLAHAAIQIDDKVPVWLAGGTSKDVVAQGTLAEKWPDHPSGIVYLIGDEWSVFLHEDVDVTPNKLITPEDVAKAVADATVPLNNQITTLNNKLTVAASALASAQAYGASRDVDLRDIQAILDRS